MLKTLELTAGSHMLVKGLARIRPLRGVVEVFGAPVKAGANVVVPRGRQVPLTAAEDSQIEVYGGVGADVREIDYDPIPEDWRRAAEEASGSKVVMVLGDVDVGKSGFTLYLANMLIRKGLRAAIVDPDIGQSDVGPPCTIGMALLDEPRPTYWDLPLTDAYFVGDKTPTGHLLPMVVGTKRLVDKAVSMGAAAVIINTTGMVYGGVAYALKRYKVEAIRPDVIVAIQREGEIEHLLRMFEGEYRIIRVGAPKALAKKTGRERTEFRAVSMARYLRGGERHTIELDRVRLVNVACGTRLNDEELESQIEKIAGMRPDVILHDRRSAVAVFRDPISREAIIAVRELLGRMFEEARVAVIPVYRGLVVGLFDREGRFMGLGTLEDIDFKRGLITINSPVKNVEEIAAIHLGYISLNDDFSEKRRFRPGQGLV